MGIYPTRDGGTPDGFTLDSVCLCKRNLIKSLVPGIGAHPANPSLQPLGRQV